MTKDSIVKQLRGRGLKITPQRLAIIDALVERQDRHPSARDIYKEAKKRRKSLSLSTAYATLGELNRCAIIKTLEFDAMENRYEGNPEEHVNLICGRCKRILDYLTSPAVNAREVTKKTGFSVTSARMEYYGYCRECGNVIARKAQSSVSRSSGGAGRRRTKT